MNAHLVKMTIELDGQKLMFIISALLLGNFKIALKSTHWKSFVERQIKHI